MNTVSFSLLVLAVLAVRAQRPDVVPVLSRSQTMAANGEYTSSYLTGDGIRVSERGILRSDSEGRPVLVKEGNFAYHAPGGEPISLSYVADEQGFRANGAHLPVAPRPSN